MRVRLRQQASQRAGQEAGLILREDQPGQVRHGLGLELVDTDERDVGVLGRRCGGGLTEGEPDGDDDGGAALDELTDVVGVVRRRRRLDEVGGPAELLGGLLGPLPRRLVERLVVDLADVGDQADDDVTAAATTTSGGVGALLGGCGRRALLGCRRVRRSGHGGLRGARGGRGAAAVVVVVAPACRECETGNSEDGDELARFHAPPQISVSWEWFGRY